jgi:outer membrane protein assembly factor BamA
MMKTPIISLVVPIALLLSSCSVKRHLPKGVLLFYGSQVTVKKTPDNPKKAKPIKKALEDMATPKKNRTIFGYPYKVALWYTLNNPKKSKGFRNWLANRLGQPPVLSTNTDLNANIQNMQVYLEDRGYFKAAVGGSKKIKGYKLRLLYTATVPRPYTINSAHWILDSTTQLSQDILKNKSRKSYVKANEQYDLENIKSERNRMDLYLKRKGYYYFTPGYIKSYIDSTIGGHQLNVLYTINKNTPLPAKVPQTIRTVTIFPDYTLSKVLADSTREHPTLYDSLGFIIKDTVNNFRPSVLLRTFTYQPGSLYSPDTHNQTLSRFINLGAFQFVKTRYELSKDSVSPKIMDVYYYLTPQKKKNITTEIGGFTKSNSFTGGQLNVNWRHRNLFKGAEQLNIKGYGAFEISNSDSLSSNNNWRVGGEISLLFPRFITPFTIKENNYVPPFTKFSFGYEWMRRQLMYTKSFFHLQYDLTWKKKANIEQTLSPVNITYTRTSAFSPEYLTELNQYPVLEYSNRPELIIGSSYNFTYNSANPKAANIFYFNFNLDIAGNITGLIKKPDTAFSKKIAGAYFAQYAKVDLDFHYTRKLASNTYWANRIEIGMSLPYGNSAYLPFSRQFLIGGSNSLRGFSPRQLGPGRVLTNAEQQAIYPQIGGDEKLELQSEFRFPILGRLRGALFTDAGNIWMKNELLYGSAGKFTSQFIKDLAVDAGVGLRVDINILIIRLDVGSPLRKPWLSPGKEWVIRDIDFGNSTWRSDNLVFNIGIGYPF